MSPAPASPDTLDGHCLAEDLIHALARGRLDEHERCQALDHLDECELCQALLADEVRELPLTEDDLGGPTLIQVDALVGGRYRIQRFVARGGMGEVYEAWDEFLSERVALKTINPLVATADQARASARFRQEVQLSRRVADPHVCRIYEFGQQAVRGFGRLSYLTMEFIEGQTLGARLRRGPRLDRAEVVELCRQLLRGLGAAHSVGVLHRDFKSDNVMLRGASGSPRSASASGSRPQAAPGEGGLQVVIMDFGLACLLGDPGPRITERHELVGSAAYMAPEQLEEGASLSAATDIYAFGVVLFEMLTGHLPFEGSSPVAVALQRLRQAAPAPSAHVPELAGAWDALVSRCLARSPSDRFGSTSEVAAALEAVVDAPHGGRQRSRSGRLLAGAIACAAAALGVAQLAPAPGPERAREVEALSSVSLPLRPASSQASGPRPAAAPSTAARSAAASSPAVAIPEAPTPTPAPGVAPIEAAGPHEPGPFDATPEAPSRAPSAPVGPASAGPAPVESAPVESTRAEPGPPPRRAPAAAPEAPPLASAPAPAPAAPAGDVRDLFFLGPPGE